MMGDLSTALWAIVFRAFERDDAKAADAAVDRPWIRRGTRNAIGRLGIAPEDETEIAIIWAIAFEAGAQDCASFARIVLSDPQIKGRELEALALIGEGFGHAAIFAALRASKPDSAGIQTDREATVVAFPKNRSRGADADRKKGE